MNEKAMEELQAEMNGLQNLMDTALEGKARRTARKVKQKARRKIKEIPMVLQDAQKAEGKEGAIKFMIKQNVLDPIENPWILRFRLEYQATSHREYDDLQQMDRPFAEICISELQLQEHDGKKWQGYHDDEAKSKTWKADEKARNKKPHVVRYIVHNKIKPLIEMIINHLFPDRITGREAARARLLLHKETIPEDLTSDDQVFILDILKRAGFEDRSVEATSL